MKKEHNSDKVILVKIGKHLAELRKAKGLTQRQLGEKIYAGEKTISKWERGMIAPDITMIKQLSEFYKVSTDELLSGEKKEVSTLDAINVYSKQAKHKILKKSLIVLIIIIIFFVSVFLVERHYRWRVEEFQFNEDFSISGYLFSNNEGSKIVFNDINYDDPNAGYGNEDKTYWIKLSVYSKEKEVCSTQNDYENAMALYSIFDNYNFVCESNKKLNLSDLYLHIEYYISNEKVMKEILLKK